MTQSILSHSWGPVLARGILAVCLGLVALFWPGITAALLVLWIGAYFIVDGIFTAIVAVRSTLHHRPRWFLLLRALAGIVLGVLIFLWPEKAALFLAILVGIWAIFVGIMELGAAFTIPWPPAGRWLLGISGVLSIALGTLFFTYPVDGILVILWILGVYALLFGILMIASAVRLRNAK